MMRVRCGAVSLRVRLHFVTVHSITAEKVDLRRVEVRAIGVIDEHDVDALTRQLIPNDMGADWELLVDMTEMSGFTPEARQGLAALQQALAARAVRTAFVADRPRLRGLALWLAHTTNDPLARPFHQRAQAESWLASREGRVQSITGYLERARIGRDREPSESPSQRLSRLRKRQSSGGGD